VSARRAQVDAGWMAQAVDLARQGLGCTRPNPPVGAVIVKGPTPLGSGFHRRAGGPHAEIHALRDAGSAARGATLYVTLEPCSTQGRTGACTDAILTAGIRRVVVGCVDPNPKHASRGLRILSKAGCEVTVLKDFASESLIAPFVSRVLRGRPFVTLKLGMSADGRIADRQGTSQWITGADARDQVQALRRSADAILVGAETARIDDPSLLPRPAYGRKPYRIVLHGQRTLPSKLKLFTDAAVGRTIIAAPDSMSTRTLNRYTRAGAQVWPLAAKGSVVSVDAVLARAAELGVMHLLCEGGGEVAAALLQAGAVDRCVLFTAPVFLGGGGRPGIGGSGWALPDAERWRIESVSQIGSDLRVDLLPPAGA